MNSLGFTSFENIFILSSFFFFKEFFFSSSIYLFIYDCAGSLFLPTVFL